ncbi:MAG: ribonuclease III [Oscillospiraceae bacterium]|nr:ribonuclease III [Oscillospiraceae bacterium]
MLEKNELKQKSILSLAYLGDAVYELLVREYLAVHSNNPPARLHQITTMIVCSQAQSEALALIESMLTEEEAAIVKRGRNSSKAMIPKNSTPRFYRAATALEALFGYLELIDNQKRIKQLFQVILNKQILSYIELNTKEQGNVERS